MSYASRRDDILGSMSASFWLKDAIRALDKRDPIDAINDASTLAALAESRMDDLYGVSHGEPRVALNVIPPPDDAPAPRFSIDLDANEPDDSSLTDYRAAHGISMTKSASGSYVFAGPSRDDLAEMIRAFWGEDELIECICDSRDSLRDSMCADYAAWNKENGLNLGSADEHLHDPALSDVHRAWLASFCARWDEAGL